MSIEVPQMVSTREQLLMLVDACAGEEVLAFDLEADSLHHYREKVCLMQVATESAAYLIDPLALTDISPLGTLFANRGIRKVFHGADYDIRSMRRDFGLEVNNLFDTMVACQFLGEKEVGLAAVLKKRFGVELDKRYQKADWSRRPLQPGMIEYALADTSLLVALYRQLRKELVEKDRLSWVEEESELISKVSATERNNEPLFRRFKGADKLDYRTLAVLEELLRFRDGRARAADRPPFKIMSNESLLALATKKPAKQQDLGGIPGLSAKLVDRYGNDILRAVGKGMEIPAGKLPSFPKKVRQKPEKQKVELLKRLKTWRDGKAAEVGIAPGLLAANALLEALSEREPAGLEERELMPPLKKWQLSRFGPEIVRIIRECAGS
jgi:ribonuclease D